MTTDPAVQAAQEAVTRLLARISWASDRTIAETAVAAARPIIEGQAWARYEDTRRRQQLDRDLADRRADPEFLARIRGRVEADRPILDRLADPDDPGAAVRTEPDARG